MGTAVSMGFPGYFLVVADFIMRAKKQGIVVGPAEVPRPARTLGRSRARARPRRRASRG
jgi:predicted urease superfamily metal-dependent hydrolase